MKRLFVPCTGPIATLFLVLWCWYVHGLDGQPYAQTAGTIMLFLFVTLDGILIKRWWKIRLAPTDGEWHKNNRDEFRLKHYLMDVANEVRADLSPQEALDIWERIEERLK